MRIELHCYSEVRAKEILADILKMGNRGYVMRLDAGHWVVVEMWG